MARTHLVWDWTGPLLDGLPLVVSSTNSAFAAVGGSGVDSDEHRRRFRRPVAEAAAVGVPHEVTGQAVRAYVVLTGAASPEELAAHCAANLARFKRPATIDIVDSLPHSAIGKVRKTELRDAS